MIARQDALGLDDPHQIEGLLVGRLPGVTGAWLAQYAHHLAQKIGPVGLLDLAADAAQVELVSDQKAGKLQLQHEQLLPAAQRWLVRWREPEALAELADDLDRLTLVTGVQPGALERAIELIEQADRVLHGQLAGVGVVVVGCDGAAAGATLDQLAEAVNLSVRLVGVQRQVCPVTLQWAEPIDCHGHGWQALRPLLLSEERPSLVK